MDWQRRPLARTPPDYHGVCISLNMSSDYILKFMRRDWEHKKQKGLRLFKPGTDSRLSLNGARLIIFESDE